MTWRKEATQKKACREIKQLLHELYGHNCTVYSCTVAHRRDADVVPLNNIIKQICEETYAQSIEVYIKFIYGNGNIVQHLYGRDGIHLHARGCSTLVANINKAVTIIQQKTCVQQDRQANSSVTPHSTQSGSNGYVSYAPDRGSPRNGDSRNSQLQTGSYGYKIYASGRGSRNGYSRYRSSNLQTQTGYRDHAPGQVAGNSIATDQRRFDSIQRRRIPPKAYFNVCGLNNHDTNNSYRKWHRSASCHSNSWSESRRYGRYRRQSKAPAEQRAT
ncbi:hypothetical protein DPMN_007843 [Dreissena polymorpha]|uniref:Uncharacterized protein n=1 Tax=Dreissena polymorpha TaxID=45954 RepID=A0A9D4RYL4_DREPO|nr:hypothetical protein DPMN_007843 [Dreissena polymorpha]